MRHSLLSTIALLSAFMLVACAPPKSGQSGSDLTCSPGLAGDDFCLQNLGPNSDCNANGFCELNGQGVDQISMEPDSSSISFFHLPINSLRSAVSAHDAERNLCISVIWTFDTLEQAPEMHCDNFGPSFPYIVVTSSTDPGCQEWNYGNEDASTQHSVLSADGCVRFDFDGSVENSVDINLEVSGPLYTGKIHLSN